MDAPKSESIMKFVLDGKPVYGECLLSVPSSDTLMDGFQVAKPGVSPYPNFFEVTDFDFGMSLTGSDDGVRAGSSEFARWRSASPTEYKDIKYPLEFDKFSFKRQIDRASPVFFQACCTSQSFTSAVLVKRLSQGTFGDTVRPAMAYMRVVFTSVLVTGIDWSDGDIVQEKCDFICQQVEMTIRRQSIDGGVSALKEAKANWPSERSLKIRAGGTG